MNMNKEYKMLREEIMFNMKQVYLYFALVVTAVSAMLVYFFNNIDKLNSDSIFIAIFILLICAATRVKRFLSNNVSISSYMEVFLEPNIDERNWETRCHHQVNGHDSTELNKRKPLINNLVFKSLSVWFLLGIITYILYIINMVENSKNINLFSFYFIFNTILFLIVLFITLFHKDINRDMFIKHWKKVKEMEEEHIDH